VAGANSSRGQSGFRFRRLNKPEEYRASEELQRLASGTEGEAPTAAAIQRAYQDHGGMVLGAFVDIYLAGVSVGFLGWDGRNLYHYAQATAVRPEYQNHHVGFQLNAFLREEVLKQGLGSVRSVLDPLRSRAAYLAVRRLGARPEAYLAHYYGQVDSEAERGSETDRLRLTWELAAPSTESRLAGKLPSPEEDHARWQRSSAIIETELSEEGFRHPTAVAEPSSREVHLEIPFDLDAIEEHSPAALRPWRHAARDAFRSSFDLGYRVEDFAVLSVEHERRSFYLLSVPSAEASPPKPTP
jgi:predicted GNAT superfamily acetyltransferase